jgi:hypothetical protein
LTFLQGKQKKEKGKEREKNFPSLYYTLEKNHMV